MPFEKFIFYLLIIFETNISYHFNLFSLMLNNPQLLLQILAFHVECIVKAYAEGFLEIVEPDQSKIPAEEMINCEYSVTFLIFL